MLNSVDETRLKRLAQQQKAENVSLSILKNKYDQNIKEQYKPLIEERMGKGNKDKIEFSDVPQSVINEINLILEKEAKKQQERKKGIREQTQGNSLYKGKKSLILSDSDVEGNGRRKTNKGLNPEQTPDQTLDINKSNKDIKKKQEKSKKEEKTTGVYLVKTSEEKNDGAFSYGDDDDVKGSGKYKSIIAVHFKPESDLSSQQRLSIIRKLGVNPMKRVHTTLTGFQKYKIKEKNPNKKVKTIKRGTHNILIEY